MAITATYIGQSTVKVTNAFALASGLPNMVSFQQFANAVADAITGARPQVTDTTMVTAGAFVVGQQYVITNPGTTDFTLVGAANNNIGTTFTATGAGAGTGTASSTIVFPAVASTLSGMTFGVTPGVTPQLSSGWSLYDSYWGGIDQVAGVESPIYTQVFRSLNTDGQSYKNIILRYNTVKMEILTSTCEEWVKTVDGNGDVIDREPINECWTFNDSAPVGYNLTACDMLVMVSPHWCVLHSYLNDEPSLWAGVFENVREDVLDTVDAGNPCWGWISSTLWMLGAADLGSKPLNGTDYTLWSMPRTKQGYTASAAAKGWGADYGTTFHPHWLTTTAAAFVYYLGNTPNVGNKFTTSGWDSTRKLAMPIKPISDFASSALINYGGIYGIKVIAPAGANMNKIIIPTDKDGNSSPAGNDRYHWLLNNHYKRQASDVQSWGGNTTWAHAPYSLDGGERPELVVSSGSALYVMTNGGGKIIRLNAATGEKKTVLSAGGYTDMKFDGQRFLYVTSNTGLTRLDTANDLTTKSVTVSGGFQALAITGDSVLCAIKTANTTPVFYRYKRNGFTDAGNADIVTPTVSVIQTKAQTSDTPVLNTGIVVYDMVSDFEGNVWAATCSTDANNRLIKIGMAPSDTDPLVMQLQAIPYSGFGGGVTGHNVGLQLLDGNTLVIWYGVNNDKLVQVQVDARKTLKTEMLVATKAANSAGSALTANVKLTAEKIDGVLFVMPRNSGYANICFSNALGNSVGSVLAAPVAGSDQFGVGANDGTTTRAGIKALSGAYANSFIYYDGARIYSNSNSALKIWTNVHGSTNTGGAVIDATTIGQVAIPS